MIPQNNQQNNIERAILSTFIFNPKELEKTALNSSNFQTFFYQKVFQAIQTLQEKEIPIDENFIEREMGSNFNQQMYLELISAMPIVGVEKYEKEMIRYDTQRKYQIEIQKINEDEELSVIEKINKIEEIGKKTAQKTDSSSIFKVQTMRDVVPETPVFFLKDKLPIQKNEITLISAIGGSGKSFVALWIASMLSRENRKVFAYLSEDSVGSNRSRFNVLRKTTPELLDNFEIMGKENRPQPFIGKEGRNFIASEYFLQLKTFFAEYEIIILDPLIAFLYEDENNNVEARFLLNLLNEWCEKESKTLIIIHHHNKGDEVRGASAFVDAVRLHYTVSKKENNDTSRFMTLEKSNHYVGAFQFEIVLFEDDLINNRKPSDTPKYKQGATNGREEA